MSTVIADDRLRELEHNLRPGQGACPFVVREPGQQSVTLRQFDGGRDAIYVLVSRKQSAIIATIGYAPFVAGTTLIYDATDAALQGKARPFDCDLTKHPVRVYAVLPVQIESIAARWKQQSGARHLHVTFLDAQGETIQAALPFETSLVDAAGRRTQLASWCTGRDGNFAKMMPDASSKAQGDSKFVVRSRLTGREEEVLRLRDNGRSPQKAREDTNGSQS